MTDQLTTTPAEELAAAQQAYRDLGVRIANGDTDVTPDDLDQAAKQVEFLKAKVTFADEAQERERAALVAQALDQTRADLAKLSTTRVDKALKAMQAAMDAYVEAVHAYNTAAGPVVNPAMSMPQFEYSYAHGVLHDRETGEAHVGNVDARQRIRDAINATWRHYTDIGARPSSGPLDQSSR